MEMEDMESRRDVRCCYDGEVSSRHRRSKSGSERSSREVKLGSTPKSLGSKQDMERTEDSSGSKKMPSLDAEVQNSLKQEILQLEKRLLDQFKTRCALEKALGCDSSAVLFSNDSSMPKFTKELVREIALLELEVMYLEQYLLSLYRKAFNHQRPTLCTLADDRLSMPLSSNSEMFQDTSTLEISSEKGDPSGHVELSPKSTTKSVVHDCQINCQEKFGGLYVQRSQSSLSQKATCSTRISPIEESFARALRPCHSQPLSFLEEENNHGAREISLEEHISASIDAHAQETPNKLSEEMVRCMCAIYCKLAEPPLPYHGPPSSPVSSFSSTETASPRFLTDGDIHKGESILESWLINLNPFRAERLKEFSEPYSYMIEITSICQEPQKVRDVPEMLQVYKSILHRLRKVEPRKMNHEEKLAFWINIHNALMMHAYVECGIPLNNVRRASFLVKASCTIGGRSINAAMIQGSILCRRTHCSGQWNQSLPYPRLRNKVGDQWQEYNIHQQEPVLHFALCSGCHSDPALRVYTPKRLFQQLEAAKEEFIRATVRISKEEKKILIPKIVDLYAKEMKLTSQALTDMIQCLLPETLEISIQRFLPQLRPTKAIECQSFNFNFRYLLSTELVE